MNPTTLEQITPQDGDVSSRRMRRLLQSAAIAAIAVGFAAALPTSFDGQFSVTKAFAESGESGEGGGDGDGGNEGG